MATVGEYKPIVHWGALQTQGALAALMVRHLHLTTDFAHSLCVDLYWCPRCALSDMLAQFFSVHTLLTKGTSYLGYDSRATYFQMAGFIQFSYFFSTLLASFQPTLGDVGIVVKEW
jgi:hypothetical protein